MKSKTLLISNLYASFFVCMIIHWGISLFGFGWDIFGRTFRAIYDLWLGFPVDSDLFMYHFRWDFYSDILYNYESYVITMFICSIAIVVAYVLSWVSYATEKSIIAGISAIIYFIVAFFMPIAIVYTLPLVALSIAGFFCQKALD